MTTSLDDQAEGIPQNSAASQEANAASPAQSGFSASRLTQISSLMLSVIGLAISAYLTITHFSADLLVCSEDAVVDCHSVTTSEQSQLLGIPVAVLGLAFFAFMTLLCLPAAWKKQVLNRIRLISVGIGVIFVVYLVAAELVLIGKICLWCTAVHVVTLALAGLLVTSALRQE